MACDNAADDVAFRSFHSVGTPIKTDFEAP